MTDIENLIANVKFTCFKCGKESGCHEIAAKRDRVDRLRADPNERPEITVYCENCGAANTLSMEDIGRTNLGSIISSFLR